MMARLEHSKRQLVKWLPSIKKRKEETMAELKKHSPIQSEGDSLISQLDRSEIRQLVRGIKEFQERKEKEEKED